MIDFTPHAEPDLATKLKLAAAFQFERGRNFFTLGRYDDANEAYQKGLAADPQDHEGWTGLADVFWVAERYTQAENCYRHALKLHPGFPPAEIGLAETLVHNGQPEQALEILKSVDAPEQQADVDIAYGNAYMQQDRFRAASRHYKRALDHAPKDAACWRDLAMAEEMRGNRELGLQHYETAVEVSGNNPDGWFSRFTVACAYLLRGYYQHGWTMYEFRRHNPVWGDHQMYKNDPAWDGTAFDGTLLLYEEQGLGDLIQFLRYVPLTAAKVKTLILDLRPDHRCLASLMDLPDNVVIKGDMLVPFDCVCPMMSQPFMLKQWAPLEVPPYLKTRERPREWPLEKPVVALTWFGNAKHRNDRRRSMTLDSLAPLIQSRPDIMWFTISPEKRAADDIQRLNLPVTQVTCTDLVQACSVLSGCKLVISVDTATLHLAGALGVPAWGLLPFAPDWRWGLDRVHTPWYQSLRLFRQNRPKADWTQVVDEVTEALEGWKP